MRHDRCQNTCSEDRFVDWLYGLVNDVQSACGLSERQSTHIVAVMVEKIQREYGGRSPYINTPSMREKVMELWLTGHDVEGIAQTLHISKSWVRRIIKERRV